jgi:alginate O-acetyltransferase complex protein AlgI
MAVGSARLVGIRLPFNFDAPYRAASIIDFWRRWHMTLSRFLRDYLYIPLGGSRRGPARRYVNLLITMVLGGIWHGAGFGFALWGAFHGLLLIANHGWRALRRQIDVPVTAPERWLFWPLTFATVTIGWVFFRATTWQGSLTMLSAMFGSTHISSADVFDHAATVWTVLTQTPLSTLALAVLDLADVELPAHPVLGTWHGVLWLLPLLFIATLGPTSQRAVTVLVVAARRRGVTRWLAVSGASLCAILFLLGLYRLNHVTEFLYFQF